MHVVGPHAVTCASLTSPEVNDLFEPGEMADVMFCDPPWGEGAVKLFATLAAKNTGQPVTPVPYEKLMDRLFELACRFVSDHVFIETGNAWRDDTLRRMGAAGLRQLKAVELLYSSGGKKLPNVLLHGSFKGNDAPFQDLYHASGPRVARQAVAKVARPGAILFDPCCGMGYSARAAIANGMTFRGNELNPARLAKTIAFLEHQ